MASNSGRKSGSSGRSSSRKRVVIGADETTRVRYSRDKPEVESERRKTPRQSKRDSSRTSPTAKASPAGRRMANEKRDERDRRRRAIMRRRVAFGVAVVVAVVAVVWVLGAVWSAPLLPVKVIEVSGTSRLTHGVGVGVGRDSGRRHAAQVAEVGDTLAPSRQPLGGFGDARPFASGNGQDRHR